MPSEIGAGIAGVGFTGAARARAVQHAGGRFGGVTTSTPGRAKDPNQRYRFGFFGRSHRNVRSGTPQKVKAGLAIAYRAVRPLIIQEPPMRQRGINA